MLQGEKEEREAWRVAPLPDLVRHIVGQCHNECRVDMARLETLVELILLETPRPPASLLEVRDLLSRFCGGMRAHLTLEEHHLFPYILATEAGVDPGLSPEGLASLRKVLEGDHEAEAALLRSIRELTARLSSGEDPGSPAARIHEAMKILSQRLQKHMYLETHFLFPRTR
ncbi:MAG TPA: hemerythrin domain-containing protein [Holophaga sp.]|nr:hemerythrin domain-containing protein [Holophaga sp.]